jgi:RNA polymerase sigma-70 factor (ECF subfamily)
MVNILANQVNRGEGLLRHSPEFLWDFFVTIFNFTSNQYRNPEQMTEIIPDETIMLNVKNGNLTEMSVLFERYHQRLYNFFLKMGLKSYVSQDLTQNLFFRMIKYRQSYKNGSKVKSWIYQIARNLHADYCKKQKSDDELFTVTENYPADVTNEDDTWVEDDFERLDRAMSELSDAQKEIIVLSRYQGLKYGEISGIINQSVPAIKVAMHRAIKQLRSIYLKQI